MNPLCISWEEEQVEEGEQRKNNASNNEEEERMGLEFGRKNIGTEGKMVNSTPKTRPVFWKTRY